MDMDGLVRGWVKRDGDSWRLFGFGERMRMRMSVSCVHEKPEAWTCRNKIGHRWPYKGIQPMVISPKLTQTHPKHVV